MTTKAPSEIRVDKARQTLILRFGEDREIAFPAEMLRVFSPSAEVQGHSHEQRKLVYGKRNVQIMQIMPVGNYAIRIVFDDMHDTGIFSWEFLQELSETMASKWELYLGELEEKGLSR